MATRQQSGFTLLEVVIALSILALAMAAIMRAVSSEAVNAGYLSERTLAHWVAMNKVTEYQLDPAWPGVGTQTGTYDMANVQWRWEAKVSETEDPDVKRVDISIFHDSQAKAPSATLMAYLDRPVQ